MAPCAGRHLAARTRPAGTRTGRMAAGRGQVCPMFANRPAGPRRQPGAEHYLLAAISAFAIGTTSAADGAMISITASPALNIPTEIPDIVPVEME
jgi:hypothetical protein